MARQRRRVHAPAQTSGRGALLSSMVALGLLLTYQCSEPEVERGGLLEQLVTPSSLSLPKSATTRSSEPNAHSN